jgi:hypothetical protein
MINFRNDDPNEDDLNPNQMMFISVADYKCFEADISTFTVLSVPPEPVASVGKADKFFDAPRSRNTPNL